MAGVTSLHLNVNKLTILLTGAHGFVGLNLAKRFIDDGHKVADLPRELLMDPASLEIYIKKVNPNYIFHLASYGNMYEQKDEDEIFATNCIKTYFLLKSTLSIKYTGFVYVSSSSVYGTKSMPMHEKDVLEPVSLYGATKACGEYLARYFALKYDKPIITARPFSITGVGEQKNHLIPTLIDACLKKKKAHLVPDATHDFIDIADFIDGILTLSLNAYDNRGRVFNVGTGTYWSNKDVAEIVEKKVGKKLKIQTVSQLRDYDSNMWVADNTRLKMLGWYPKKTLEDSISEMVYESKNKNS